MKNSCHLEKHLILYKSVDTQNHIECFGSLAQLGEHLPYKQRVVGSSPTVPTICGGGSVVERRLAKANVAGSNPVLRSIFLE